MQTQDKKYDSVLDIPPEKMTRGQMMKAALVMGVLSGSTFFNTAYAAGATGEISFSSLADDAMDNIKSAGKAVLGVLASGITIVGTFKGYQYLKSGIRRA